MAALTPAGSCMPGATSVAPLVGWSMGGVEETVYCWKHDKGPAQGLPGHEEG